MPSVSAGDTLRNRLLRAQRLRAVDVEPSLGRQHPWL